MDFFGPNYSWLCVLSYDISCMKSCWLTQECFEHDRFSTFCLRKMWEKWEKILNFSFWIPLDPKLIFNDQVGSGPYAHTKFQSATWCKVSTGQKMSRKSHFQQVKSGKCSVYFHIFSNLWLLMMVLMAKQPIQTVFTCINSKNRASSRLLVKNSVSLEKQCIFKAFCQKPCISSVLESN